MDFYENYVWYLFALVLLVTNFINLLGASNNGSKSGAIYFWGGIVTWIVLIISFIFTGWIGGIALLIAFLFIIGPIGQRLTFVVFKLSHPNAKLLTYKLFKIRDEFRERERRTSSIESVMQVNRELDVYIQGMKNSVNAIQFFEDIDVDINKIDDIRYSLMASGAGEFVAYSVVRNPDLVLKYIEMEKKGLSRRDIGYEFLKGLEGVH
ncbi:hypothetical protein [Sporosarcina sp. FA9]|uniref:hypothetical protein n=1 Tax=Sporosarcina sp. FA9 TaxID=3413030 RepID=UPI003F65A82A